MRETNPERCERSRSFDKNMAKKDLSFLEYFDGMLQCKMHFYTKIGSHITPVIKQNAE